MAEQDGDMLLCFALWDCHSARQVCAVLGSPSSWGPPTGSRSHSDLCKDLFKYAKVLVKHHLKEVLLSVLSTLRNAPLRARPSPWAHPGPPRRSAERGVCGRVHLTCYQCASEIPVVPEKQVWIKCSNQICFPKCQFFQTSIPFVRWANMTYKRMTKNKLYFTVLISRLYKFSTFAKMNSVLPIHLYNLQLPLTY